jgi:hypothetical protein
MNILPLEWLIRAVGGCTLVGRKVGLIQLNSLVGDANNVTLPEQRKQTLRKTKKRKILNILYISYYVICILYYFLYISYYVFDE